MRKAVLLLIAAILSVTVFTGFCMADQQSIIRVGEGRACMGDEYSKNQTIVRAEKKAKDKAVRDATTYIESQYSEKVTEIHKDDQVIDEKLFSDLVEAYSKAEVRVLDTVEKSWDDVNECYFVKMRLEIIPKEPPVKVQNQLDNLDNPTIPLVVKVWTDKPQYNKGDRINIFVKGNKPFFARVVYKDINGNLLQLLPNSFRKNNYFQGGSIFQIPSGMDQFNLEVQPPFGEENIIVYASTKRLGLIDKQEIGGGLQLVKDNSKDLEVKTRAIGIIPATSSTGSGSSASNPDDTGEFYEASATLTTQE